MGDRRIIEELAELSAGSFYPLHVPGHKRHILRNNGLPYSLDVTELASTDNLHRPKGLIKEAMDRAAELYGAKKTFFLVNGSSCGILAAIGTAAKRRGCIIAARNSHISVFNAIRINDLKPRFIMPQICDSLGICASVMPETVEKAIKCTPSAEAVVITSPTYEGVLSDIRSIAGICHSHNIPLIVDEAHGAHLKFLKIGGDIYESALDSGADLVIQSAHKTLPALTQSAFIHVARESIIDTVRLSEQLSIYESSSPSYILMASLDEAVDILFKEGDVLFERLSGNITKLNEALSELKCLKTFIFKNNEEGVFAKDPTRLLINSGTAGLDGEALAMLLRKDFRIETEMSAGKNVLAVATIGDTEEGFERFRDALLRIDKDMYNKRDIMPGSPESVPLAKLFKNDPIIQSAKLTESEQTKVCPEAHDSFGIGADSGYAGACDSDYEYIDIRASKGRYCGEFITLSPPGIPLLIPGERVSGEAVFLLSEKEDETIRSRSEGQKGRIAVMK